MADDMKEVTKDWRKELYELIEKLTIPQVRYLIAFIKVYFKL